MAEQTLEERVLALEIKCELLGRQIQQLLDILGKMSGISIDDTVPEKK